MIARSQRFARFLPAAGALGLALGLADRAAFAHGGDEATPSREESTPGASVPTVTVAPNGPSAPTADQGPAPAPSAPSDAEKAKKLPWHGSILLLDQSVTTQTVGIGADYQSYDPVYEMWIAFKPRYYFYESDVESVNLNLWMNLYHEFTNSDTTTRINENVIGPSWLGLTYGRTLYKSGQVKTVLAVGPRLTLPTDKASRNTGQLVGLGASAALSHAFPLQGKDAPALNGVRLGLSAIYNHPLNRAINPINGDIDVIRQDVGGRTIVSDQLSGTMGVNHALIAGANAGLQITPKLGLNTSFLFLKSWTYSPRDATLPLPSTGGISVPANPDAPTSHASTWLMASLDYDIVDSLSLSLGYYNLTNELGPDAQRRNVIWSPDARMFFTITGNLDAIYDHLAGRTNASETAQGARTGTSF